MTCKFEVKIQKFKMNLNLLSLCLCALVLVTGVNSDLIRNDESYNSDSVIVGSGTEENSSGSGDNNQPNNSLDTTTTEESKTTVVFDSSDSVNEENNESGNSTSESSDNGLSITDTSPVIFTTESSITDTSPVIFTTESSITDTSPVIFTTKSPPVLNDNSYYNVYCQKLVKNEKCFTGECNFYPTEVLGIKIKEILADILEYKKDNTTKEVFWDLYQKTTYYFRQNYTDNTSYMDSLAGNISFDLILCIFLILCKLLILDFDSRLTRIGEKLAKHNGLNEVSISDLYNEYYCTKIQILSNSL